MWSLEFVEVADEIRTVDRTDGQLLDPMPASVDKRRMSEVDIRHKETIEQLVEFKDPEFITTKINELATSSEMEDQYGSTVWGESGVFDSSRTRDVAYEDSSIDLTLQSCDSCDIGLDAVTFLPTTADQSPSMDFCFVTEMDVKELSVAANVQGLSISRSGHAPIPKTSQSSFEHMTGPGNPGKRCLRDGFRWQKQLVFRSKLTMHTAFERKDNKEPAAVTALAVSK